MLLSNLALVRGLTWFGYFLKFEAAKFCQFNLPMENYIGLKTSLTRFFSMFTDLNIIAFSGQ